MIWLNGVDVQLTGPAGPVPWIIDLDASDHPVEVVDQLVRKRIGEPRLIHSTSWRHDGDAVILSFVVVIDAKSVGQLESAPIPRVTLARSDPTAPPDTIAQEQVMEHALRHLAWLAMDDRWYPLDYQARDDRRSWTTSRSLSGTWADRAGYFARIRLFLGSWVSSASPRASSNGGM